MCNVYGKSFFSKKLERICKRWVWTTSFNLKEKLWRATHNSSLKKKFRAQRSIKKSMLTVFIDMKWSINYDVLKKGETLSSNNNAKCLDITHFIKWYSYI